MANNSVQLNYTLQALRRGIGDIEARVWIPSWENTVVRPVKGGEYHASVCTFLTDRDPSTCQAGSSRPN